MGSTLCRYENSSDSISCWEGSTYYSVTSVNTISNTDTASAPQHSRRWEEEVLTDKVIESHQCSGEFPVRLHDHPNLGPDTSVDEFYFSPMI